MPREDLNEEASVSWPNQSFLLLPLLIFFISSFPHGKRWYYLVTFVTSTSRWSSLSRFSGLKLGLTRILYKIYSSMFEDCSSTNIFPEEILFQERPLEDTGCMFSRIKAVDRRFIECGCNGTNFWNLKSISQETFVPRHRQLNQPTEISKSYKKPSFRYSI